MCTCRERDPPRLRRFRASASIFSSRGYRAIRRSRGGKSTSGNSSSALPTSRQLVKAALNFVRITRRHWRHSTLGSVCFGHAAQPERLSINTTSKPARSRISKASLPSRPTGKRPRAEPRFQNRTSRVTVTRAADTFDARGAALNYREQNR